jgi:acyl-CoA reductase-like NAD-dependent aldehyde dehydrogenase
MVEQQRGSPNRVCAEDVDRAVGAAREAFAGWSRLDVQDRAAHLLALADIVDEYGDELAQLDSLDNGNPSTIP